MEEKRQFPASIIFILIAVGASILSNLIGAFTVGQLLQLGPFLFTGIGARILNGAAFVFLTVVFIGMIKRDMRARNLAFGWYVLVFVLYLVNFASFLADRTLFDEYYREVLTPDMYSQMTSRTIAAGMGVTTFFGLLISVIAVTFLLRKKEFFEKRND